MFRQVAGRRRGWLLPCSVSLSWSSASSTKEKDFWRGKKTGKVERRGEEKRRGEGEQDKKHVLERGTVKQTNPTATQKVQIVLPQRKKKLLFNEWISAGFCSVGNLPADPSNSKAHRWSLQYDTPADKLGILTQAVGWGKPKQAECVEVTIDTYYEEHFHFHAACQTHSSSLLKCTSPGRANPIALRFLFLLGKKALIHKWFP